jgi:hypothetical protein
MPPDEILKTLDDAEMQLLQIESDTLAKRIRVIEDTMQYLPIDHMHLVRFQLHFMRGYLLALNERIVHERRKK